ncbi:MAG: hypothetical protein CME66_01445 [Halobacteriovoraceae bacterium]|nr:hypothetical protein [Halobacteriovoraceae bacterium]
MKTKEFFIITLFFYPYFLTHAVSLQQLIKDLKSHPKVKTLELDRQTSRVKRVGQYLNWAPSVTLDRTWMGYSTSSSSQSPLEYERLSLKADLNLFNGLEDYASLRATQFSEESTKYDTQQRWQKIQIEAAENYIRCFRDKMLYDEATKNLEMRRKLAQVAKVRYQKGSLSQEGYLKLKIDYQLAINDQLDQEQSLKACFRELEFWTESELDLEKPELLDKIKQSLNQHEKSLEAHPGAISRQKFYEQAQWEVVTSRSSFLPKFNLSFSSYPATEYQEREESVFFSISWRLFDRGTQWSRHQVKKIDERLAKLQTDIYTKEVKRDSLQEKEKIQRYSKQYNNNAENSKLASGIFSSSLKRFERGVISSNEVALDQGRVINARNAKWNSWYHLYHSWLKLIEASGESLEKVF